ncbi:MAG: general secretion pathway protein GspL [Thioalkalivibrio sp.]|nr:MAG: general secretion pathway protein GspL [Thioalkalivibrio sp.]
MNWFVLALPEPDATAPEGPVEWARIGAAGVLQRGSAPLDMLPDGIQRGDRVLALVPGERVVLHHVSIPARSRSAQLQALPYALEDRISEDLDAMHIVPGPRLADGPLLAAVVARRDMDTWLGWLEQAGVRAHQMLPDTALLPEAPPGRLQLYWAGDRCLVAVPGGPPLALSQEVLPWWLHQWDAQQEQEIEVEWHGPPELSTPDFGEEAPVRAPAWDGDLLSLIAPAIRRRPALNLLSGPYAPPGSGISWAPWRVPAAIAAALVLLWGGSLWLEIRQLEREARQVDLAISDLFESTLPETRMVDPVGQFRQMLETGTDAAATGAGPVATRLGQVAPVLAGEEVELRQLRADEARLELELDLESIARLDALRGRMRADTGATVRILSAESDEDGVRARLQIEEDAS